MGARHAHIAEAAFLFELLRIGERARVGKQSFFKSSEKNERKLQSFGGMQRHERDTGVGVVLIGVRRQCRVVKELGQGFTADFGIVGGIGQFLQVFNAAEGFRGPLGLKRFNVAGAVDDETDQLGQRSGVAGSAEGCFCFRIVVLL